MDNFDLRKYLAEGKLYEKAYNLPDSDSNTDKYVNNHWDSILKDILRAHTDLRNSKGGEGMPERPSQIDIDIVLGRFDGADEFMDVDPSVYDGDYFDFYDMYLVTQRDEENTKDISVEDYPEGDYSGYTKRDDLPNLAEGKLFEENTDFPELEDEFEGAMDAMVVEPKVYLKDILKASAEEIVSDDYYEIMNAVEQGVYSEDEAVKLAKAWAKEKLSNLAEGKLLNEELTWYNENKMDNFDLRKYLAEGKLLKENIDMATILSHDDYHELYIGNRAEHDASHEEEQFSDEYIIDLKPGMYQMIYWNDEGPDYNNFDSKEEYIKDAVGGFWGEDHFIEKFGIEAELDAAGDNWESVFNKHIEDNLDMYYEELNKLINNSEADGDSASGVVLLQNGKVVAGEATDIRTRFD